MGFVDDWTWDDFICLSRQVGIYRYVDTGYSNIAESLKKLNYSDSKVKGINTIEMPDKQIRNFH